MAGGGGNEPNLTPFIDLFSVLVCFLLMTAAWLQLDSLQVTIDKKPEPTSSEDATPPPPEDNKKKINLSVFIYTDKIVVKENETEVKYPNTAEGIDRDSLASVLQKWRKKYPEKKDLVLNSEGTVPYGALIRTYDILIASDWPDIGINPN